MSLLSHDVASGSDITPYKKSVNPSGLQILQRYVMTSIKNVSSIMINLLMCILFTATNLSPSLHTINTVL